MSFKIKKKKNKYIWKCNEVKIVFSESSYQAHDDYAYSKGIEDALYLYYTVTVYARNLCWVSRKKRKKWVKIAEKYAYDFPSILELQYILDQMVNHKMSLDEYRKVKFYHCGEELEGMIGYEYNYSSGSLCDDDYIISQTIVKEDGEADREWYEIYIGCTMDSQCGNNSIGVKCKVSTEDAKALLELVNEFLNDTVDAHNREIEERNTNSINSYYQEDNVLFQKEKDEPIGAMYLVGDKLNDITVLKGKIEDKDYYSVEYHDCIIKEIKTDSMIVSSKYVKRERDCKCENLTEDVEIAYNTLLFIWDLVEDERLGYKEQEIADDFMKIWTSSIKSDFKTETEDELYKKYRDLLVDRYWMCREEHNFENRIEDRGHHENTYEAVKVVINILKESVMD